MIPYLAKNITKMSMKLRGYSQIKTLSFACQPNDFCIFVAVESHWIDSVNWKRDPVRFWKLIFCCFCFLFSLSQITGFHWHDYRDRGNHFNWTFSAKHIECIMDFPYGESKVHMANNQSEVATKSPLANKSNAGDAKIIQSNCKEWKR